MRKAAVLVCGPQQSAVGGGPTHIKNMMTSPLKNDYQLIHFEVGSRGAESPARDERWHDRAIRLVTSPFALAMKLMEVRPDIVHLNSGMDQKAFWRDALYLCVAKLFGRKVLMQMHGGSLEGLCAGRMMRRLAYAIFSASDAIVVIAQSQKSAFQRLGVAERLSVIPNCVDMMTYQEIGNRVHSGRVRRMLFVGRLIRPKGIFEAMEAVRLLRAESEFRDLEFDIAGSGPARDEIERWIAANSANYVHLLGPVHGRDKIALFREADVFVFPSYHLEGLPYAIIESLAAGTPVIVSRVAGIPDIVVEGVHGTFVDPGDPGQIIEAVRQLARSKESLQLMSMNCMTWARQELSLDRMARSFGEVYETLRV